MRSFKLISRQAGLLAAVFAVVASAFVPALASAATVTSRSVTLSSSSKSATGVSYQFSFTAINAAGAAVIQFCSNSPLIGEVCTDPNTTPGGFTAAGATASGGATISGTPTTNKVIVTDTITAGATTFTLDNITNPNANGPLYVRVVTYANSTDAAVYSTDGQTLGTTVDQGSFAVSIADSVSVSGAVLESLTFCAAKNSIDPGCDLTKTGGVVAANPAPTVKLGQDVGGGVIALQPNVLSSDTVNVQLSTNAASGAVVSMKSNATGCGGLIRSGAPTACDIAAAGTTGTVAANDAKFGVKLAAPTDAFGATGTGTLQPASSNYDTTDYRMNYIAGDTTGVTGTYGDQLFNSNSLPVSNKDMTLSFAASINNSTPAGSYSADLGLIATGTF